MGKSMASSDDDGFRSRSELAQLGPIASLRADFLAGIFSHAEAEMQEQ